MKRRSQGIITYEGKKVYYIDNTLTIIESVHNNYAKGFIIKDDFSLKPCFIAKKGIYFAHGDTLREANADALNKYMQNMPIEDRIANFMKQYPKLTSVASNKDLFSLHGMLTGSCNFGRREFATSHNIDVEKGKMTVKEFIDLTINSYGSEVIHRLKDAYGYK